MENASNALLIAGGVLVGILVLSLAVYLFADFGSTSARINEKKAEQQIVEFNARFTSYEKSTEITIYNIISLANFAKENNDYYEYSNTDIDKSNYIQVILETKGRLETYTDEQKQTLVNNDLSNINSGNSELPKYKCTSIEYHDNKKVKSIKFKKI